LFLDRVSGLVACLRFHQGVFMLVQQNQTQSLGECVANQRVYAAPVLQIYGSVSNLTQALTRTGTEGLSPGQPCHAAGQSMCKKP
jgi:hypothetical protein